MRKSSTERSQACQAKLKHNIEKLGKYRLKDKERKRLERSKPLNSKQLEEKRKRTRETKKRYRDKKKETLTPKQIRGKKAANIPEYGELRKN